MAQGSKSDPLDGRIVRFNDLDGNGTPLMFIDSILPGHKRMNYSLVGDVASENPDYKVMCKGDHTFQAAIFQCAPGSGPAYHTHDYVEAFLPLSGTWRFYWGDNPETPDSPDHEAILDPWDFISIPAKTWRGFENTSDRQAWCFGILEAHQVYTGVDPYWPDVIKDDARKQGLQADENGKMIKPDNYEQLIRDLTAELPFEPRA